jgi:hypothetical protein
MGGAMDLAAAEGGTLASFPARLLHGQGWGHKTFPGHCVPAALDLWLGSQSRRCINLEGTARLVEALPLRPPAVPSATPTGGGAG